MITFINLISQAVGYIYSKDFCIKLKTRNYVCLGCDRVFCADEDPCSSKVHVRLDNAARAGRTGSDVAINDYTLDHGWYE